MVLGSEPVADFGQHRLAAAEGKAKVAAQDSPARAVTVEGAVAVLVHLHPIVSDQPDEILRGQGFVQPELAFQQFDFCRVNVTTLPLPGERSAGREVDQREQQNTENEEQSYRLEQTPGDIRCHLLQSPVRGVPGDEVIGCRLDALQADGVGVAVGGGEE